MTGKSNILIELEGIAPLLAAEKVRLPYQAPEEYFALFADTMLDKIHMGHTSFTVPGGYFEGFAAQMMKRVRGNEVTEELKEVAPFLNEVSKTMPFYVPQRYFENFEVNRKRETVKEPAKLVSLFGSKAVKWAAAAVVLFTIGFSWMYFSDQSREPAYTASLSLQEMDSLLNQVEAANLDGLLEKEGNANAFNTLLLAASDGVEKSVQTVTTDELNMYLENHTIPEPGT